MNATNTTESFAPTHRITFTPAGGAPREILVCLTDEGAAYTREEWEAETAADWERDENGVWTCQGQATPGGANGEVEIEDLSVEPAQHVVIEDETFGVDTEQQIRTARAALIRAGLAETPVYAGSAPDTVRTSATLLAAPPVLVSWDNGATTATATDATAADFLARFGEQNVRTLLRDHDLPTDYDSALALVAALDTCCAEGEVLTLP